MGNFTKNTRAALNKKQVETKKINMPFSELMKLHQEAERIANAKTLKELWDPNRPRYLSKVREFWNNNGVRIQAFMDRHNQIDQEFYEWETTIGKDSKKLTKVVMEGEAPNIKPKFKEGKTQEAYDKAMKEFFSEIVPVEI